MHLGEEHTLRFFLLADAAFGAKPFHFYLFILLFLFHSLYALGRPSCIEHVHNLILSKQKIYVIHQLTDLRVCPLMRHQEIQELLPTPIIVQ
jgi:hypothetical protein